MKMHVELDFTGQQAKYIAETDDPTNYPLMEEVRKALVSVLGEREIILPAVVVKADEEGRILHVTLASQFLLDVGEGGLESFLGACGLERVKGKLKGKLVGSDVKVVCSVVDGELHAKEVVGLKRQV